MRGLYLRLIAACVALAACSPPSDQILRDPAAPIASIAEVDITRLTGDWVVVEAFESSEIGAVGDKVRLLPLRTGQSGAEYGLIIGAETGRGMEFALNRAASGRFEENRLASRNARAFWVLWVDTDYRTAVIGTPSGRHGWVMDRGQETSPDRLKAARDILDWYGYDLSQLSGQPR
ncbi:lipocalin family protein [Litoreibacter roseus]|uniref:Lipocalin n=1 Tax=Litoreibacter roseus TaxID=2601869 RepID=A0A6N6JB86_9RHOB|nr:lipocalin family protein [Litoreibacter roseus]GFE63435.1 lipocalin [Litoreibacter roseus]